MKTYIGFSVDMDRAYSDYNMHGQLIPVTHKDYKYKNLKNDFISLTNKLINYFNKNNYNKSVTWYVNEADYHISVYFNDILKNVINMKLGLHTHLNSKNNAESYNMSEIEKIRIRWYN